MGDMPSLTPHTEFYGFYNLYAYGETHIRWLLSCLNTAGSIEITKSVIDLQS